MKKETENQSTASTADKADRPKVLSPAPSEEVLDGPVRGREAVRVLIAGAGYIPGRLAKWLLGRGEKQGGSEEASLPKEKNE